MTKNIIIGLFTIIAIYLWMPTFAYDFIGLPILLFIAIAASVFIHEYNGRQEKHLIYLGGAFVSYIIILLIFTLPMFHSSRYQKLLEDKHQVVTKVFQEDMSPININEVRLVDKQLARKVGEKVLGEDIALGSVAELGNFTIQSIKGKLYWVAPLVHSGFFKWLNADSTPGYVIVSATNEDDVKLVLNHEIKYQPNAFFSTNLERHVWLNGYMTQGMTDYSFELDDEYNPHWVITKYNKEIGVLGSNAVGSIIVDPKTGDIQEYSIKNTPKWVDRIQPEEFINTQLEDYGIYKKGWLNAVFAHEGIITTTHEMSLVFGKDGQAYWYTGMKSVGKEGSTIGFMLVNTRNKETTFYKISGATEDKAKLSAEGIVQEKGYTATAPILYNILDIPTYILTLKDKEGLVKNIAMVSVKNYGTVGIGISIKSALRNYKSKLLSKGNNVKLSDTATTKSLKGLVSRINRDIKSGNTFYYLTIDKNKKVFILDSSLSEKIILTQKGDKVSIKYEDTKDTYVNINEFKNLSY